MATTSPTSTRMACCVRACQSGPTSKCTEQLEYNFGFTRTRIPARRKSFTTETRRHGDTEFWFLSSFLCDLRASVVNFHSYGCAAGPCKTQDQSCPSQTIVLRFRCEIGRASCRERV